jgi:hypothetical protein
MPMFVASRSLFDYWWTMRRRDCLAALATRDDRLGLPARFTASTA